MEISNKPARRRGRPPKSRDEQVGTRQLLLHAGLEVLTEKGFATTGIEEILKRAGVPKGSFYHYFASKEAFGAALIDAYARYFANKLDKHFSNTELSPLARIEAFILDAEEGMRRHEFRRGCLIGNLGQEMAALPEAFRMQLQQVFTDWQTRLTACLQAAQEAGEISREVDCQQWAAFFWTAWEGAVLRSKLEQKSEPLHLFARFFLSGLNKV
jgi:TetR/AcrR family transcriptional repressor of nem operon